VSGVSIQVSGLKKRRAG